MATRKRARTLQATFSSSLSSSMALTTMSSFSFCFSLL